METSIAITGKKTPLGTVKIVAIKPGDTLESEITLPLSDQGGQYPNGIDEQDASAWPPKQVIGDWKESDHQVLSFLTQDSWAGGGQIENSEETQDIDRFAKIADLETRFPESLQLLPLTIEITGPDGQIATRILGDMVVDDVKTTFVAFGSKIHTLEGVFPDVAVVEPEVDTLTSVMVTGGKTVLFRVSGEIRMFIPQGENGYQVFDGEALGAQVTTIKPQAFVVFSRKLWAVDADGKLWKSLNGTDWIEVEQIDPGYVVRGLIDFYDRYDAPAPHMITDSMTFGFDEGVPALYPTELNYAPHPYSGVAYEKWRTDLYVAIGMGIQRYTRGTVNAAGLDRNDGCGREFTGYVSTMVRGFNDLFAGVSSTIAAGETPIETDVDQGLEFYLGSSTTFCHVQRLTGGQAWHGVWTAPRSGGTVQDLYVSTARLDYVLMWTWQGRLYVQQISTGFDNPSQNPTAYFMPTGTLTSSWFDFGMKVSTKTIASFELQTGQNVSALNKITLEYQIDDWDVDDHWETLAILTEPQRRYELRMGANGTFPTNQYVQTRYDGQGALRIRYRLRMDRDPADRQTSPQLKALVITYQKKSRRLRNWDFVINCHVEDHQQSYGMSNKQRRQLVKSLTSKEGFTPLNINGEWVMVSFAYANGPIFPGNDMRGDVRISALEAFELKQDQLVG